MQKDLLISSILLEILRGYSILDCNGKDIYFKHFVYCEYLSLDEYEEQQVKEAVKDGIKTEEELIQNAVKSGFWSTALEEQTKSLEWTISKSQEAAKKITDNIQKAAFNRTIEKQEQQLQDLQLKRRRITQYSAENCASSKRSSKILRTSLFYDEDFTEPISEEDVKVVFGEFRKRLAELNDETNLVKAAYKSSFFDIFCFSYRDPMALIKKDLFTITVLQKHILSYANMILNKLKNVDMPDDVKRDPIKILKYSQSTEDDSKKTEGVEDLREKMAKRGGKLKAEDLLS